MPACAHLALVKRVQGEGIPVTLEQDDAAGLEAHGETAMLAGEDPLEAASVARECIHGECARLVRYEINPDRCTNCDKCREVCAPFAIEGEKRKPFVSGYLPYRIRQKRCTHCGECIKVCPEGAIYVVAEVAEAVGAGK